MAGEFKLSEAVPWGRNAEEYAAFFDLAALPPNARILDCAAGPSSFNAEWSAKGRRVIAADPLYGHAADAIEARVIAARPVMMAGLKEAEARFCWDFHGSPSGLEATRMTAMRRFLADYGDPGGRYVAAALPGLPFADGSFDLVLCSHFLFMYGAQFDLPFHLAAVLEMVRVGGEVRLFPLLDLEGATSRHLEPLLRALTAKGYSVACRNVGYEFQKGGNRMLCVMGPEPPV